MMRAFSSVVLLGLVAGATLGSGHAAAATCSYRAFSGDEDNVLRAYIGFYGRPADAPGLSFWANRLKTEGSALTSIVQAFGVS